MIILVHYGKDKQLQKMRPGKKYPHYTGNVTLNGVKKNASAWLNTEKGTDPAKAGQPDISIKLNDPIKKINMESKNPPHYQKAIQTCDAIMSQMTRKKTSAF